MKPLFEPPSKPHGRRLEYAPPAAEPISQPAMYRMALAAGLLPMACGTVIYLLWLATGAKLFIVAGLLTILGGVILFLPGIVSLCLYAGREYREATLPRKVFVARVAIAALMLFGNFPLAMAIISAAM